MEGIQDASIWPMALTRFFEQTPFLAVAYSGGLDSRLLCHAAKIHGCDVIALHAKGQHVPAAERAYALAWARRIGLRVFEVPYEPLELEPVRINSKDRCYYCKKGMLEKFSDFLEKTGENFRPLCDGGNLDDTRQYRPGLRAVAELGIISPLAQAALTKSAIRELAKSSLLENPDQASRPCLLTRFAYDAMPSLATLRAVEEAEARIGRLLRRKGLERIDYRLRLRPRPLLQIEPVSVPLIAEIGRELELAGFPACEILSGKEISGFYDRDRSMRKIS